MSGRVICRKELENGLVVEFCEHGNRYFGDYHQVKVTARCRIALTEALVGEDLSVAALEQAQKAFGAELEYSRLLKQMGVAGADVDAVQQELIANFSETAMRYMRSESFASRFVSRQLANRNDRSRRMLGPHA